MRKHINASKAATGWTIRIDEREERAPAGREKSALLRSLPKRVWSSVVMVSISGLSLQFPLDEAISQKPHVHKSSQSVQNDQ